MINKLFIKNFRSIKNIKISNIKNQIGLIGENSSGKSAVLEALLVALGEKEIQKSDFRFNQNGTNADEIFIGLGIDFDYYSLQRLINYKSMKNSEVIEFINQIKSECEGTRRRDVTSKSYTQDFRKKFLLEIGFEKQNKPQSLFFGIEYSKSKEKTITLYHNSKFTKKIDIDQSKSERIIPEIFKILLPPYAYLRDERGFEKERNGESDSTTNELFALLLPTINNNVNQLGQDEIKNTVISELTIPQINEYLLKRVQEEAGEITESLNKNFKIYYNEQVEVRWIFSNELFKNLNIKTNFYIGGFGNAIDFQSIGSGTRSLYKMVLLQTLLERQSDDDEPVLFLLEEPELYLYPKLEYKMENFIIDLSKKNQVIVTTHSPASIKSFPVDSLYKVERKKETVNAVPVTKISKIESKSQVTELLGYDITYLLGKDYIIFVEGPDDKKAYEALIKKIFGKEKSSKFITMTSVSKLSAAVSFDFLDQIRSRAKSIYIIDSDGKESDGEDSAKFKEKIIKDLTLQDKTIDKDGLSSRILLTEYCMLECYTFEYRYLKQQIDEEKYWASVKDFLIDKQDDINTLLKSRKKHEIRWEDNIESNFEHVRKFGFNKKLIKTFRGKIGGQGFKKLSDLNEDEMSDSCKSLIESLKKYFD